MTNMKQYMGPLGLWPLDGASIDVNVVRLQS